MIYLNIEFLVVQIRDKDVLCLQTEDYYRCNYFFARSVASTSRSWRMETDKPRGRSFDQQTRRMSMHDDDVLISPLIGLSSPVASVFVYSARDHRRINGCHRSRHRGGGHWPCRGCTTYSRRSSSSQRLQRDSCKRDFATRNAS